MPEFLRVKDKETGHEYSVPKVRYDADPDLYTKVDKDATDPAGTPLPPKYKTSVAKKAAEGRTASPVSRTSASPEVNEKAGTTATDKEN